MTLTPVLNYRPALVFLGLAAALLLLEWLVVLSPAFGTTAALPAAVTFDVVVGLTLLFYWQLVRRYRLPVATVAAAFGGALALGYGLIPEPHQQYLGWARHGLVLAEALLGLMVLFNLRRVVRAYRAAARQSADFLDNLTAAFTAVLGRSFGPLVSEVALFRYALLGWWGRVECQEAGQVAFSGHRDSGFSALMGTVALLSVIETGAVHLLVQRWSPGAAWLLLMLDGYTLLFLLAHLHAVRLRPAVLTADGVLIRVGFVWRVEVARRNVAAVQRITDAPAAAPGTLNVARQLITVPNLLLTFAEPVIVTGLYGSRRTVHRLALYVDAPAELILALRPAGAPG
ncbi:MAG: hypothetical protein H7Z21_19035 [Hymenobacter sp.]|nr:hypothetical protein [Hymenobacter sp.]